MAPSGSASAVAPIPVARPAEVAAAGRLGDLLVAAEVADADLPPLRRARRQGGLRVVCLTAPIELGGRDHALLEQADLLAGAGAEVTVLWRGRALAEPGVRAKVIEVPFGGAFCDLLPPCDLVIAGCWDLVLPARRLGVAPVALVEQGDLLRLGTVPDGLANLITRALRAAARIWCDEPGGRRQLAERYGVDALPLPSALADADGLRGAVTSPTAALRQQCEDLVEAVPRASTPASGRLLLSDLPLAQPEREQLEERLATCATRDLLIPLSQPAIGPYRIVRWRVVGEHRDGLPGETRLWAPLRCDIPVRDATHQDALDLLRSGRPERALRQYAAACETGSEAEQAVVGRWLVLSLLASGRPSDAAELAGAFARDFPTHPDYLYLVVVAARAASRPIDLVGPIEAIRLLGEGSQYDEWFEDPCTLLADQLRTGWPGMGSSAVG